MNELKWLTLESCVEKWSNEGYKITSSEALQFCSEEKLKVSCHLFKHLVRPIYIYSPLLDDGYYHRVARMILAKENKKSQKGGITFSIDEAEYQNKLPSLSSEEFTESFLKQRDEYDLKLNSKAKEIFSRWKKRGTSNISFKYGANRILDGYYQLALDKALTDCLTRMALNYPSLTLDSLCVVNDNGERFQLINNKDTPVVLELRFGDLVIQTKHRIEFEKKYLQGDLTEPLLAWGDLFISEFNSYDFKHTCKAVTAFISENNRLPESHRILFSFMKSFYDESNDGYVILPSKKCVPPHNFYKWWCKYTGKRDQK